MKKIKYIYIYTNLLGPLSSLFQEGTRKGSRRKTVILVGAGLILVLVLILVSLYYTSRGGISLEAQGLVKTRVQREDRLDLRRVISSRYEPSRFNGTWITGKMNHNEAWLVVACIQDTQVVENFSNEAYLRESNIFYAPGSLRLLTLYCTVYIQRSSKSLLFRWAEIGIDTLESFYRLSY